MEQPKYIVRPPSTAAQQLQAHPVRNAQDRPVNNAPQTRYICHDRPNLERYINEREGNPYRREFQEVLAGQYRLPAHDPPNSVPENDAPLNLRVSMTSSMAVGVGDDTDSDSDSDSASQSYMYSTQSIVSDASTSSNRAVPPPRPGRLACAYSFLACNFTSDSFVEWDRHCKSHFRGHLPKTLTCPFDCTWTVSSRDGTSAWAQRTAHIVRHHRNETVVAFPARIDPGLIQHLWGLRILTSIQVQELRRSGRLSDGAQTYVTMADTRRDQRDQQRHQASWTVRST